MDFSDLSSSSESSGLDLFSSDEESQALGHTYGKVVPYKHGRCFVSDGRHRTLIQLARHFVNLRVVRTLTSRSALSGIEGLNATEQAREGVHFSIFRIFF